MVVVVTQAAEVIQRNHLEVRARQCSLPPTLGLGFIEDPPRVAVGFADVFQRNVLIAETAGGSVFVPLATIVAFISIRLPFLRIGLGLILVG